MTERRSPFYAFRYMVTPFEQTSLLHEWEKSKEELMKAMFIDIYDTEKLPYLEGKKKYIFFAADSYKNNIFAYNFAKEIKTTKSIEGEKSIINIEDERIKHILVFVNVELQIVLIERKTTAFQDINSVIRHLEWYFRDRMRTFHYTVKIYPLAKAERFWKIVEESDKIFELSLTVSSPNLFGAEEDFNEALKEIKEETNNDELTIELNSKEGELKVPKTFFNRFVQHIHKIGGVFRIVREKNGVTEKMTNLDTVEKTHIVRHKDGEYTDEEMKDIETKMKQIDGRTKELKDSNDNEKAK